MSYFFDMVKEFVCREMKKENGSIVEDTEFCFACGLYMHFAELRGGKLKVKKISDGITKNKSLKLLKASMSDLRDGNENELMESLLGLIEKYEPEQETMDYVMEDVIKNARKVDLFDQEVKAKKREKTSTLVCKTYKLPREIVDGFADACKREGVKLGPQLTALMEAYIQGCNEN